MYCPSGNATDPIWRVLASSDGIYSWTPLKPQHSNPNPNPFANQLWCIDFLTPPTPLIIAHRFPAFLESLKMYSNNILNFQESTTILNAHTKKIWKLTACTLYIYIYIYIYISLSPADRIGSLDALSIRPYRSSLLVALLDCTRYPYRADVCKTLLVGQHYYVYI